jgi:hypothetical protein
MKGQNLATKEDIEELTTKVEAVKIGFDKQREDYAQENRLKLAALTERLKVHQEAYTRWRELVVKIGDESASNFNNFVRDSEEWFHRNCLYFTNEAREAFLTSFNQRGSDPRLAPPL